MVDGWGVVQSRAEQSRAKAGQEKSKRERLLKRETKKEDVEGGRGENDQAGSTSDGALLRWSGCLFGFKSSCSWLVFVGLKTLALESDQIASKRVSISFCS